MYKDERLAIEETQKLADVLKKTVYKDDEISLFKSIDISYLAAKIERLGLLDDRISQFEADMEYEFGKLKIEIDKRVEDKIKSIIDKVVIDTVLKRINDIDFNAMALKAATLKNSNTQ